MLCAPVAEAAPGAIVYVSSKYELNNLQMNAEDGWTSSAISCATQHHVGRFMLSLPRM